MTKTSSARIPAANQPPPIAGAAESDEMGDEISLVLEAITAAGGQGGQSQWKVKIYQIFGSPRNGMSEPWLFDVGLEDLAHLDEKLGEDFPEGGRFRARVIRDGRIFRQFDMQIAPRRGEAVRGNLLTPLNAPPAPTDAMARVLDGMNQMMLNQNRFMEAALAKLSTPAQSQTSNITDTLALIKAINESSPKPEPNIGLGLFQQGFKMALDIGEMRESASAGGGGVFSNLAKEIFTGDNIKALMSLVQPQPAPTRQPAPANAIAPPHAPAPLGPFAAVTEQFTGVMAHLAERAKAGTDPSLAADWVFENVPPAVLDMLNGPDGMHEPPQIVEYLAQSFPVVGQYRSWFEGLVSALLTEDDAALEESDQAGQDAGEGERDPGGNNPNP
jgi:hypothetical protein